VGYTTDDLLSFVDNDGPLAYGQATHSIVNLQRPGNMLAEHRGNVYASRDGGCRWRLQSYAHFPETPLRLVAGAGANAFAFTFVSSPAVF